MSSMSNPMGQPSTADPFPNRVRGREQLDVLWRHIAQVLSDGVRSKAMAGEGTQQGLPSMRQTGARQPESPGSWERALVEQGMAPASDFRSESQASQGEIGGPEMSSEVEQLGDPGAGREGRMTAEEVAQTAYDAGFRGEDLATIVAVGMSESDSNPRAHNPDRTTGDNSYGIWQINMIETYQAERLRQFGLQANEELWDPEVNARAAYQLYQGRINSGENPFVDWSDYKNGRYLRYWDVASQAANAVESGGSR